MRSDDIAVIKCVHLGIQGSLQEKCLPFRELPSRQSSVLKCGACRVPLFFVRRAAIMFPTLAQGYSAACRLIALHLRQVAKEGQRDMTESERRARKWLTAALLVLVAAGFYLSAFLMLTD